MKPTTNTRKNKTQNIDRAGRVRETDNDTSDRNNEPLAEVDRISNQQPVGRENNEDNQEREMEALSNTSWAQTFLIKRKKRSVEALSRELRTSLYAAATTLLDLLQGHLKGDSAAQKKHAKQGLSLPATAVGWLAIEMYTSEPREEYRDKLAQLRSLLPQVTRVRVTADEWPVLPTTSSRKRERHRGWENLGKLRDSGFLTNDDFEETWLFLEYYSALMECPPVDMCLFPGCEILLVENIPEGCVRNVNMIQKSLKVFRVENTPISDLASLLLPLDAFNANEEDSQFLAISPGDPLAPPIPLSSPRALFPQLTHIKLSGCGLSGSSGIGSSESESGLKHSPLARLTNLQSICLSHNDLVSENALSGLSKMPHLAKVDLSYNRIECLKSAHYHLGNIQTLVLSHNHLKSAEGIERLYSLQELWLDHNRIGELSKISALARLPELETLHLKGNPIEVKTPKKCRVEVLSLFQEKRKSYLPVNATYRDLQTLLPLLDGKKASVEEMKAIKIRSYRPPSVAIPVPDSDVSNIIDLSSEAGICERTLAGGIVPTRGIKRKFKTRQAEVDNPTNYVVLKPLEATLTAEEGGPVVRFTLEDVLQSLCRPATPDEVHVIQEDEGDEASFKDGTVEEAKGVLVEVEEPQTPTARKIDISGDLLGKEMDENTELSLLVDESIPGNDVEVNETTPDFTEVPKDETNELDRLMLSPIKCDNAEELKKSTATTEASAETNVGADTEVERAYTLEGADATNESTQDHHSTSSHDEAQTGHPLLVRLSGQFPDSVTQDDQSSFQSSVGSPSYEGTTSVGKYHLAEDNSVYDGPPNYGTLKICKELELYFRVFVFPARVNDNSLSQSLPYPGAPETDWRDILKNEPRIQLWPADRKQLHSTNNLNLSIGTGGIERAEEFRRLWKERVVGCGKSALRRLTPNRGARYGFHGELLWSDSSSSHIRPDTVAEFREVIACFSNLSFYLIVDHDKVSVRSKKRFPLAIAKEAEFMHAVWPHALARHPFSTLRAVTIGFGFQRLTLRFGNSQTPSADDFIYVLLISNKAETVALLKDIQDLFQESQLGANMFADNSDNLLIENDDRHVLDALGVAVAPDVVGVVLHYQILGQRWRRGDRGIARRVCVLTDTKLFLLDEDYVGDGSESVEAETRQVGETVYRLVDSAALSQITKVQAADADPAAITIIIRPTTSFQKSRNWRLQCRDRVGAERLVEDVRKALSMA
jgi:hypothetical protein